MSHDKSYVLVTGATGFIGSNLVKYLASKGRRVLGLDIVEPDSLVEDYLEGVGDYVDWVQVDLTDFETVMKIVDDFDLNGVIHAAVFTPASKEVEQMSPRRILTSNLMGTVNTLELARKAGVRRFVYASSSGVYGSTPDVVHPVPESSPRPYLQMSGFYGITKVTSEKLAERYAQLFPMTTTSMRIAAPYGPMDRPTWCRRGIGYTHRLLKLILTDRKKTLYVKGLDYTRDRTYVLDTVHGLVAGLDAPEPIGSLYNLSCGINVSVEEILTAIREVSGLSFEWEEVDDPEDADCVIQGSRRGPLSIDKAKTELGFNPQYTLKQGIKAYYEWWTGVERKGLWLTQ